MKSKIMSDTIPFEVVNQICEKLFDCEDKKADYRTYLSFAQSCPVARQCMARYLRKNFKIRYSEFGVHMMTKAGHKPFICFNQLSALAEYVTTVEIKSGKESLFNKKWFPEDIEELLIDTQIAEKLSDKAISRLAHAVPNVIKVEGVTHHVLNIAEKVIFESAKQLLFLQTITYVNGTIQPSLECADRFPNLECLALKIWNLISEQAVIPSPKTMFNNVKTLHILDIMIDNTFNASYIEAIERFLERFPAVKDVTVYMQGKSFYDYSDEKFVESRKVFFNTKFKPNINLYVDCRLKTNLNPQLLETGLSVVDKKRSKWTFEYGNERQRLFVGKQT